METLIYLAKSGGILTIFYLVYIFILQKDTFFTAKRHFLAGGILASLLLPFITFTKTTYKEISFTTTDHLPEISSAILAQQAPVEIVNWWSIILLLYGIGFCTMAGRIIFQLISLRKLIRSAPSEKKEGFYFVKTDKPVLPFSFFKYIVFNPESHSEEALQMILQHEKVHASQWHSIDIIAANLLQGLQWLNPFSWFYKKRLEENLEFIADHKTVRQVSSKIEYQLVLVQASSSATVPPLTTNFYQSFIKKRIIMLNKSTSKRQNIWKISIILPLLAFFLWSFNVKEVVKFKSNPPGNSTESIPPASEAREVIPAPTLSTEIIDPIVPEAIENEATSATPASKIIQTNPPVSLSVKTVSEGKEVRIKITKTTTKAELDKIATELKEAHNIDFSYSNLQYNSSGEITSIAISYSSDSGSGNYSLQDDDGIEDFYFYLDKEEGKSGFWSEGAEKRMAERALIREERMAQREREREIAHRDRIKERFEEVARERAIHLKERRDTLKKQLEEAMHERGMHLKERREIVREQLEEERAHAMRNEVHVKRSGSARMAQADSERVRVHRLSGSKDMLHITKSTTDADLEEMKARLATKGVSFNYKKVKRNAKGELTGIKVDVDNGKGSKTSKVVSSSEDKGIKDIFIKI